MRLLVIFLFLAVVCIAYCQNATQSSPTEKSKGKVAIKPKVAPTRPNPPGKRQQALNKPTKGPSKKRGNPSPTRRGNRKARSANWDDENAGEEKPKRWTPKAWLARNRQRPTVGMVRRREGQRRPSQDVRRSDTVARSLLVEPDEVQPQNYTQVNGFDEPGLPLAAGAPLIVNVADDTTTATAQAIPAKVDPVAVELMNPPAETVPGSSANTTAEQAARRLQGRRLGRVHQPSF